MTDMFSPLTLPCGHVVPNRLCKAAMEENMAELQSSVSDDAELLAEVQSGIDSLKAFGK